LDLSAVTAWNAAYDDGSPLGSVQTITATTGGRIDLSSLPTLTTAVREEDVLNIVLPDATSSIDLSGLVTISATGGYTQFTLTNGAVVDLPAVQTLGDVVFSLASGADLNVTGAAPVTYNTVGLDARTVISVVGAGSVLDLSAVTAWNAAYDDGSPLGSVQTITATTGGRIDLSSLPSITAPFRGEDRLDIVANGGSAAIDLSALTSLTGAGHATFSVTDGTMTVGSLSNKSSVTSGANGLLTFLGDFTQLTTGVVNIGLANTGFGKIAVGGTATLDNVLNLVKATGFAPTVGQTFEIMTFASRNGTLFDTVNGTATGNGLFLNPQYGNTTLTLSTAAAPASATTTDLIAADAGSGDLSLAYVQKSWLEDFLAGDAGATEDEEEDLLIALPG
jgi:hypothetical protein